MTLRNTLLATVCFASAAVLAAFVAGGSATVIEMRSRKAMQIAMETHSHSWVDVRTDGLQVILLGTAPSEAERFRAITRAGTIVDSSRIVDNTGVENTQTLTPPAFSIEMLRNDDGVSLIGFIPAQSDRKALVETLRAQTGIGTVTDMLETGDYPVPPGWNEAVSFAMETIRTLPRAKVSVDPGRVEIEAITDSPTEKARVETSLARRRPIELKVISNISAPRPVITPFTLRFVATDQDAHFDACSADNERARNRILAAARDAGATGTLGCTIGMGTPSPQWGDAVTQSLQAIKALGAGTLSFSDADIALTVPDTVPQAKFDQVVGDLEANLPEVFSLKAEHQKHVEDSRSAPEFSATLAKNGTVELRGRTSNARTRDALESYARAQFGAQAVTGGTRLDAELPPGWPVRTMAALEALDILSEGNVHVTPDLIKISGITGNAQASDTIARLLTKRVGERARIALDIRYDKRLDPVLGLPTAAECVDRLNAVLTAKKISFEPGSAVISSDGRATLDDLAQAMKDCQDFRMEIAGHTDSQGRAEMNLALSQDRAQSVLSALMDRRVLTGNLTAKGYGAAEPIADNRTEEGREANRRIEFVLLDATPIEPGPVAEPAAEPADAAGAVTVQNGTAQDVPSPQPKPADLTGTDAAAPEAATDEGAEEPMDSVGDDQDGDGQDGDTQTGADPNALGTTNQAPAAQNAPDPNTSGQPVDGPSAGDETAGDQNGEDDSGPAPDDASTDTPTADPTATAPTGTPTDQSGTAPVAPETNITGTAVTPGNPGDNPGSAAVSLAPSAPATLPEQDPTIEIPVAPADQSPAHPPAHPDNLPTAPATAPGTAP